MNIFIRADYLVSSFLYHFLKTLENDIEELKHKGFKSFYEITIHQYVLKLKMIATFNKWINSNIRDFFFLIYLFEMFYKV